jgi:hypothetical protein
MSKLQRSSGSVIRPMRTMPKSQGYGVLLGRRYESRKSRSAAVKRRRRNYESKSVKRKPSLTSFARKLRGAKRKRSAQNDVRLNEMLDAKPIARLLRHERRSARKNMSSVNLKKQRGRRSGKKSGRRSGQRKGAGAEVVIAIGRGLGTTLAIVHVKENRKVHRGNLRLEH